MFMEDHLLPFIQFRRELAQLEEAHCLAEAQRLARLVEQEAEREKLLQKEEELKTIVKEAESMKAKAEKVRIGNMSVDYFVTSG